MNKRKIVIFVEGQTEQQFVRDVLLQWYGFDANCIGIQCHKLHSTDEFIVPFEYGSEDSEAFYRIVDASGESNVLPSIRKNAERYTNLGYEAVIGLRDMFCDAYLSAVQDRKIHQDVNEKMLSMAKESLPKDSNICHIRFAIMEIETWMLSMPNLLLRIDARLTHDFVLTKLKVDLSEDLEKTIYHPALCMKEMFALVGRTYDKHSGDVSAITSQIRKEDCLELINSEKCTTFRDFMNLVINEDLISTNSK